MKPTNLNWWTTEFCFFDRLRQFLVLPAEGIVVCVFGAKSVQRKNGRRLCAAVNNMLQEYKCSHKWSHTVCSSSSSHKMTVIDYKTQNTISHYIFC